MDCSHGEAGGAKDCAGDAGGNCCIGRPHCDAGGCCIGCSHWEEAGLPQAGAALPMPLLFGVELPQLWDGPGPSSGDGAPQVGQGPLFSNKRVLQYLQNMFFLYLTAYTFALCSTHTTLTLSLAGNQVLLRMLG